MMRDALLKKKDEREKKRKQVISMLEAGRNDDLNMAAAPAQADEEEDGAEYSEAEEYSSSE